MTVKHTPVLTNQAWPTRVASMTRAIKLFDYPIHALEVGTWYAEGSTQIWLEHLPTNAGLNCS